MSRPIALLILALVLAGCATVGQNNPPEESSMTPPDDDESESTGERAVDIVRGDEEEDEDQEGSAGAASEANESQEREADEDENETADEETARAANETEAWPTNGSFVTYEVEGASTVRGAFRQTDVEATWTFFDGEWRLDCEGAYVSAPRSVRDTTRWQNGSFSVSGDEETPRDASPLVEPNRRGSVRAWLLEDCEPDRSRFRDATMEGSVERDADAREAEAQARLKEAAGAGDDRMMDVEENETDDDARAMDENETDDDARASEETTRETQDEAGQRAFSGRTREIVYDPDTGVILSWREIGSRGKLIEGRIVDTDAPIGQ